VAIPLGTFPDIQPIEDCGRSAVLNFLLNSLRTTARCPTIEAFVARTVPDHERPTFRTRGCIFLQSEWKTLFRNRRDMPVS
jgi:hypothetical protein